MNRCGFRSFNPFPIFYSIITCSACRDMRNLDICKLWSSQNFILCYISPYIIVHEIVTAQKDCWVYSLKCFEFRNRNIHQYREWPPNLLPLPYWRRHWMLLSLFSESRIHPAWSSCQGLCVTTPATTNSTRISVIFSSWPAMIRLLSYKNIFSACAVWTFVLWTPYRLYVVILESIDACYLPLIYDG